MIQAVRACQPPTAGVPCEGWPRAGTTHADQYSGSSLRRGTTSRDSAERAGTASRLTATPCCDEMGPQAYPRPGRGRGYNSIMLHVTCFASLGVFVFGFDQGVMSGIITGPYFKAYFKNPTAYEVGTMVAVLEIGALFSSLACGALANFFGRKKVLLYGALVFSIGGAMQTMATGFGSMVLGRIIAGFGVGALSMIVPTYQSEISPAENRGKLACIEFTGNIVGYASSVWIDYFSSFLPGDTSWRLPLAVQPIIGMTLAIGSILLPESPRWLLDKDRDEDGMRVLADLHGGGDPREPRARLEFREIKENVLFMRSQGEHSYSAALRKYWYRTMVACSAQMFAQLNGINVISYYAPLVFESAGWIGRDAILMAGINGIIYVCSTIPTWFLIDVLGRRVILMSGSVVTGLALAACSYFLYIDSAITPQAVVGCVIIFNAAFGASWGPIPWCLGPEVHVLAFRAHGTSLSTATNWFFNWVVGEMTPVLQERIGWRLYLMHAFFCLCSLILVYFAYPETMGVPLEEMDVLFGEAPGPVPQHDDEADEENQPLQGERANEDDVGESARPIRRSISSHPRFMSEEEQIARQAAMKVAQQERQERTWSWLGGNDGRSRPGLRNVFGTWGRPTRAQDTTQYTPVNPEEH